MIQPSSPTTVLVEGMMGWGRGESESMWWLHRKPEGLESDLRAKIGQNGISSRVGRQDLKFLLCYLSEARNLLMNTRNNSGDSPSLGTSSRPYGTVQNGRKTGQLGAGSHVDCKSLTNWSYVTRGLICHSART